MVKALLSSGAGGRTGERDGWRAKKVKRVEWKLHLICAKIFEPGPQLRGAAEGLPSVYAGNLSGGG